MGPFTMGRAPGRLLIWAVLPAALMISYLVSPYVALWRLSEAVRTSDCAELRVAIDWNRVRESIGRELAGDPVPATEAANRAGTQGAAVVKEASASVPAAAADDDLPSFGESFAEHAVGHALAADISPEAVAAMLHDHPMTVTGRTSLLSEARQAIDWAFFSGPRTFEVWLRAGRDANAPPVRLHMAFTRQHGWRVVGVWLPQDLLGGGGEPTHST